MAYFMSPTLGVGVGMGMGMVNGVEYLLARKWHIHGQYH